MSLKFTQLRKEVAKRVFLRMSYRKRNINPLHTNFLSPTLVPKPREVTTTRSSRAPPPTPKRRRKELIQHNLRQASRKWYQTFPTTPKKSFRVSLLKKQKTELEENGHSHNRPETCDSDLYVGIMQNHLLSNADSLSGPVYLPSLPKSKKSQLSSEKHSHLNQEMFDQKRFAKDELQAASRKSRRTIGILPADFERDEFTAEKATTERLKSLRLSESEVLLSPFLDSEILLKRPEDKWTTYINVGKNPLTSSDRSQDRLYDDVIETSPYVNLDGTKLNFRRYALKTESPRENKFKMATPRTDVIQHKYPTTHKPRKYLSPVSQKKAWWVVDKQNDGNT